MATWGNLFMGLALIGTIVSIAALLWGRKLGPKQGEGLTNTGYIAIFGMCASITMATVLLAVAFWREDFSLLYVAQNHSTDVSAWAWALRLSAVWAGREGSLLFWAWLMALFIAWVAYKRVQETDELTNMSLVVANVVMLFFMFSLFLESNNPFKVTPAQFLGPGGELLQNWAMNPLLQHWAMVLHPPTLFIGYAGLAIPFAYAIGAAIVNDGSKTWVEMCDRITVFAWFFLGVGIGVGAVWAYVVLGWGGYWAWDPVENASLLPWLTGVGLLHSFTVYRRRGGFKRWSVMLAAITYALVILGTFITRSGVLQDTSVHSFQRDPWSFWLFLIMIAGSVAAGAIVLWWRGKTFASDDDFETLTSKEASYYFNNVIMLASSLLITYLTLSAVFPSWLPGGGQVFGPSTYDAVARPAGILYVFIMAVCPLLMWRRTEGKAFWQRIKFPLIGAAVLAVLSMLEWWFNLLPIYIDEHGSASTFSGIVYNTQAILGLIVGSLAVAIAVWLFIDGARKRSAAKGESFLASLGSIIFKTRTQSGGFITHLGVGIIMFGLVGSSMFVDDRKVSIPDEPGQTFEIDRYFFTYEGSRTFELPNGDVETRLTFDIQRDGNSFGKLEPGQIRFFRQQQTKLEVDVISEPLRDVFFVFEGIDPDGNLSLNVKINPLIWFAWGGFIVLMIGNAIAMWPARRRPMVAATPARSRAA